MVICLWYQTLIINVAGFLVELTWSWVLRRSMGAVIVRETASESPDARTNLFHSPKPGTSSGNSMGIARLSPTSKTSGWMKWVITLIIVPLHNASGWTVHCSFCTPLLHWGVASSQRWSYQTVFPWGHQLTDVVHGVEDDMVQEFPPVHSHGAVPVHPSVGRTATAVTLCFHLFFFTTYCHECVSFLIWVALQQHTNYYRA